MLACSYSNGLCSKEKTATSTSDDQADVFGEIVEPCPAKKLSKEGSGKVGTVGQDYFAPGGCHGWLTVVI